MAKDLNPAQVRESELASARTNVNTFCRLVLTDEASDAVFAMPEREHRRWQALANAHPRLVVFAPTASGKSLQLVIGRTLFALGQDQTKRVLIAGKTGSAAKRIVNRILYLIENSAALHEIFPLLRRGTGAWSGEQASVAREGGSGAKVAPSITSIAAYADYGGAPVDLAFVHDVCDNENMGTAKSRGQMIEWFHGSVQAKLRETGRVIVTGSTIHREDLPNTLIAAEKYESVTTRVRDDTGAPSLPRIWPEERIAAEERRSAQSPALEQAFSQRFLLRLPQERSVPPLMEFIPETTPKMLGDKTVPPTHLKLLIDAIERSLYEPVTMLVSVPPQHAKSETLMHGLVWLMRKNSERRHAYITYNDTFGRSRSDDVMEIAKRAGLQPTGNMGEWDVPGGGGLIATGIGGTLTGRPVNGLAVVDDPFKNWKEAMSPTIRNNVDNWFQSALITRRHSTCSIIVVHTRWNVDDLAGRLEKTGWEVLNLPAWTGVEGQELALWPEVRSVDFLRKQRKEMRNPYMWPALYMGQPRLEGQRLFEAPSYYTLDEVHKGARIAIGVDLAYSAKTSADTSVAVVMAEYDCIYYVLEVIRMQCRADKFAKELVGIDKRYPGARMRWYASTTEIGAADVIRESHIQNADGTFSRGPQLYGVLAKEDKFIRAGPVAVAWNQRRVKVPAGAETTPSIREFLNVVQNFTGLNDSEDDDADALAACYDLLKETEEEKPKALPAYGSEDYWKAEGARMFEAAAERAENAGGEDSDGWQRIGSRRSRNDYSDGMPE